jgi:hypothetical protein
LSVGGRGLREREVTKMREIMRSEGQRGGGGERLSVIHVDRKCESERVERARGTNVSESEKRLEESRRKAIRFHERERDGGGSGETGGPSTT